MKERFISILEVGSCFAIRNGWFFLLGINFCNLQEVAFQWNYNIFLFYFSHAIEIQVKQHADVKCVNQCHSYNYGVLSDDPFL